MQPMRPTTWFASAALGAASLFLCLGREEVRLGAKDETYRWVSDWAKLPEGMQLGNTHGCIAVDSQGRVYVNTDTENAVIVFAPDGKFLKSWGKDLSGGLHGMTLVREGGEELLYLAHTSRHEVLVTSLDGEVKRSLVWPEASGVYQKREEFLPTAVAVAPSGKIFVADGYGKSWVHEYDAQGKYVKSFGGPGSELGKLQTPHGLYLDVQGETARLFVADRENHRLQIFDLDGKRIGGVDRELRRPCNVDRHGDHLAVADLAGRVTILDGKGELVCHLGDNPDESLRAQNGVPRDRWRDGEFISPHSAKWDAQGNLYVMDWVSLGRVSKLERVR